MPVVLTSTRRVPPPARRSDILHVIGMHGMGDNLHQRAVVREFMRSRTVHLETPWPAIYHDLVGKHLRLVKKPTPLRTQAKNMQREADKYDQRTQSSFGSRALRIWYRGDEVKKAGSVLDAMCVNARVTERDFTLPVPYDWKIAAAKFLVDQDLRPILLYRPLVMRTEWSGCAARNPDVDAYMEIFYSIRKLFYVVSVADLVPGVEWRIDNADADLELHQGELTFEALAGLMCMSSLSFASPGFATILAQAVGTPSVCVFGGYENATSFSGGARFAPYLGIDPIEPCSCFQHNHACKKKIDTPRAIARLYQFVEQHVYGKDPAGQGTKDPRQLELAFEEIHESRRARSTDIPGSVGAAGISNRVRD